MALKIKAHGAPPSEKSNITKLRDPHSGADTTVSFSSKNISKTVSRYKKSSSHSQDKTSSHTGRSSTTDVTSASEQHSDWFVTLEDIYPALDHDLQGIGAQFSDTMNHPHEGRFYHMSLPTNLATCPCHESILADNKTHSQSECSLDPLPRYLAEGPSAQYALYYSPDSKVLSTNKKCTCIERIGASMGLENLNPKTE